MAEVRSTISIMVALLLLTLLQASPTPAPPVPAATTQAPKPRAAATPGGPTTNALFFITDPAGAPIEGVTVTVTGPVDREAKSPGGGFTRVQNLRAGTYRVRFTHERFITFEKELTWRAGTATPEVAVTLNPAPALPPPPPPPPAPVTPPPPAAPKRLSIVLVPGIKTAERESGWLQRRRPGTAVAGARALEQPATRIRRWHALRDRRRRPVETRRS